MEARENSVKFHILEWVFETLNKRVLQGIPLKDLFLVLPFNEESEILWNLFEIFNKVGRAQGNDLKLDYPALFELFNKGLKKEELTLRVFFVSTSRLRTPLILNHKKYPYPRVNQLVKTPFNV